ncbi:TatD DNase family protein [Breznakibacter xylanolyticus]|uniref:TatD DNase family protein n=1 Tax=Breznakibacter xylanolyticus TaxID=990 RepID=A0A2W7NGP1_9BACT|nr:TatD family hydrolase [Breznakibacter xylanolyticus]PZX17367.1 TatD DNase family protein [Breznakibacter xylanolyticus]
MSWIDTHSHIYLDAFDDDRDNVVARAIESGIQHILMPNVDISTIDRMHQAEQRYACCKAMMGLHPTSVNSHWQDALAVVDGWLKRRAYVAVGEIGVDLYWDKTFINEQIEVFEQQIRWAIDLDLPIVIHCRDAFPEVFAVLDRCHTSRLRGVFHSFSGGVDELQKVAQYGTFKAGINGVVTFKNSQLADVISRFDASLFLLETDAPYLAPVPHRGRRNEPVYLLRVAERVALALGLSMSELSEVMAQNTRDVFGQMGR